MRVLVVSDIHSMSKEITDLKGYKGSTGGALISENRNPPKNFLLSIVDTLKTAGVSDIHALICLGDLAHQAKKLPLATTWQDIGLLAERLSIRHVVGVTGNHDIDSRAGTESDVTERIEYLRTLYPQFPKNDKQFQKDYFSDGVAAFEIEDGLIVAVDTCRMHGLGGVNAEEIFSKGHITVEMIQKIKDILTISRETHVIIAMHHHPVRIDEVIDPDYDQIPTGAQFLAEIEGAGKNILIIHGHKHIAKIKRNGNNMRSPWVFSASSLAAYPYRNQEKFFSNLFHVIEYDTKNMAYPSGRILSWEHGPQGWRPSRIARMPHIVPFGRTPDLGAITESLRQDARQGFLDPDEMAVINPDVQFLTADQIEELNEELSKHGKIILHRNGELQGMRYVEVMR